MGFLAYSKTAENSPGSKQLSATRRTSNYYTSLCIKNTFVQAAEVTAQNRNPKTTTSEAQVTGGHGREYMQCEKCVILACTKTIAENFQSGNKRAENARASSQRLRNPGNQRLF